MRQVESSPYPNSEKQSAQGKSALEESDSVITFVILLRENLSTLIFCKQGATNKRKR